MTDASFYILTSQSLTARFNFACKLIEKAYRCGQFCYVYTENSEHSQQLDDLLWQFRKNSFIPHQLFDAQHPEPENEQMVLIGTETAPTRWQKLIFNLSSRLPDKIEQCERVLEILDADESLKQAGRLHFRHYQQGGFNITTHKM